MDMSKKRDKTAAEATLRPGLQERNNNWFEEVWKEEEVPEEWDYKLKNRLKPYTE